MSDQSWTVEKNEAGIRLDKWLSDARRLGSRSRAFAAIERGKVSINDVEQSAADAGRRLQSGEIVRLWMSRPGSSKVQSISNRRVSGLHIVYEDDALLVINKPQGLLTVNLESQPDEPSLVKEVTAYLKKQFRPSPHIIHRIDRDTSGLVVFAKTSTARENLKAQFAAREPERIYWAVVYGSPKNDEGVWRDWLRWNEKLLLQEPALSTDKKANEAICHYRVLEKFVIDREGNTVSLLEIKLVTGKQNQICFQAMQHGHQLIGEKRYIGTNTSRTEVKFSRQALHAYKLGFLHPRTKTQLQFEAPLPPDFTDLLTQLRTLNTRSSSNSTSQSRSSSSRHSRK
ncbi:MAG TPA: RluA family pseudouridine synthase [Blastocatellia bacterium]|nr:RluA family pseudouridine synthase [Blastocatellia bacterium]